jgi:hypothetical protein
MSVNIVTLEGTWSRTQTTRADVNYYRKCMRRRAIQNGGSFDAVCPRDQAVGDGTLGGTFKVELPVVKGLVGRHQAIRAGKKLFEAMMCAEMCRPPKVRYTKLSCRANYYAGAHAVIQ